MKFVIFDNRAAVITVLQKIVKSAEFQMDSIGSVDVIVNTTEVTKFLTVTGRGYLENPGQVFFFINGRYVEASTGLGENGNEVVDYGNSIVGDLLELGFSRQHMFDTRERPLGPGLTWVNPSNIDSIEGQVSAALRTVMNPEVGIDTPAEGRETPVVNIQSEQAHHLRTME
jgi:hypothetical protein